MSDFIFPDLFDQPTSGLTFPWAFKTDSRGPGDANFGPAGATAAEVMLVYGEDLLENGPSNPLSQLLGYSWRDDSTFVTDTTPSTLRRVLPWKHPYWQQLYCTKVVKFEGLSPDGKIVGIDGPFQEYKIVLLTLQFSRPPYALLQDQDIPEDETTGVKEEWRRYTTTVWSPQIELLARQAGTYLYTSGTGPGAGNPFPGSIGFPVMKLGLTLTWFQLPQDAVYDENGFPSNLLLDFFDGTQLPGTVNASAFKGNEVGTLLYLVPKIEPHPLQLPAALMNLDWNEGAAQLQYNVILNFLYFDPPQGPGAAMSSQGHNNAIWADGLYYPIVSKQSGNPPFSSSEFSSIFAIL